MANTIGMVELAALAASAAGVAPSRSDDLHRPANKLRGKRRQSIILAVGPAARRQAQGAAEPTRRKPDHQQGKHLSEPLCRQVDAVVTRISCERKFARALSYRGETIVLTVAEARSG